MSQSDKIEKLQIQTSPLGSDSGSPNREPEPTVYKDSSAESTESVSVSVSAPATENPIDELENQRSDEAARVVKNHVITSMGIALVPIPIVDLVGLTGTQLKMVHSLAKLYKVPFSENLGKSLIVSLVGGFMPTSTAMTLASFAKAIPGLGTATGMVSVTVLGGATTYAIGSVFVQHFESGGTLLDFDPKAMK